MDLAVSLVIFGLGYLVGAGSMLLAVSFGQASRRGDEQLEDEWRKRMGADRDFAQHREGADGDGRND